MKQLLMAAMCAAVLWAGCQGERERNRSDTETQAPVTEKAGAAQTSDTGTRRSTVNQTATNTGAPGTGPAGGTNTNANYEALERLQEFGAPRE